MICWPNSKPEFRAVHNNNNKHKYETLKEEIAGLRNVSFTDNEMIIRSYVENKEIPLDD